MNAVLYKKPYKYRITDSRVEQLHSVLPEAGGDEVFFGYYDKCCEWGNRVLCHRTSLPSVKLPDASVPCDLIMKDLSTGEITLIGKTRAYNWQQGSRLHWITEDKVCYNVFDEETSTYKAVLWSATMKQELRRFDKPVQDSYGEDFFLAINYRRLWSMRPDYCYRCLPRMTQNELDDMESDGIWKVDMHTGQVSLIHSIAQVTQTDYRQQFEKCNHNVNHLMLSPDGKRFVFIHRNYLGAQRFDRLILSDFRNLSVVIDEHYVSHCCWIDNHTILGYLKSGGKPGFYYINVDTNAVTPCDAMSALHTGDGHPSFNGRLVTFDSYPDKGRMQKLYVYDTTTDKVTILAELYQSTKYNEETRCDLHPRFSHDGRRIFFDTVYKGHRELCWIELGGLL